MRQRNPAEHILPTRDGNVCIEYVTMVKRISNLEWGTVISYYNAFIKCRLKGCTKSEYLELFSHKPKAFTSLLAALL